MTNIFEYPFYNYFLYPLPIMGTITGILCIFVMVQFATAMFHRKVLKKKRGKPKTVNIQAVLITITLFLTYAVAYNISNDRYYENFLNDSKKYLKYAVAQVESVKRDKWSKTDIIREYRGVFTVVIDSEIYQFKAILPPNYNKYIYFVKINMDNTDHFKILPVLTNNLIDPHIKQPSSGWDTNPIPSLTKDKT